VELYNPHAIEKTQRPSQPARPYSSYASRSQGPLRTTEEIRNDVLGVFDSLQKSENLPEMDPSPLITTELLKHQKQGLYFMTNRRKNMITEKMKSPTTRFGGLSLETTDRGHIIMLSLGTRSARAHHKFLVVYSLI